jgi:hypothetical protein
MSLFLTLNELPLTDRRISNRLKEKIVLTGMIIPTAPFTMLTT